jgi:DUF1365 family protein
MNSAAGNHAIYEGWVSHRRESPREHSFRYPICFFYLDLEHLSQAFAGRWLWSSARPSVGWFRRSDHLGDAQRPLGEEVRKVVKRAGAEATGRIFLLTQLRYWGFVMNPVSFYYCFAKDSEQLTAIVAEVHNTPWGERHCYVLPASDAEIWLDKQFHVSPFMPMDQRYCFRFTAPGESLGVSIDSFEGQERKFGAHLELQRRDWTTANLSRVLWRFPFMTQRVYAGIYWQALRLWWKGIPYFPHPSPAVAPVDLK